MLCSTSLAQNSDINKSPYPKGWTWKQEKKKIYADGSDKPHWMPTFWFAVAACEQPYGKHKTKWSASSSGYVSGFGFARSTYLGYKPKDAPYDASKASTWQLYQTALNVVRDVGMYGWGCIKNGGYKYHLNQ